MHRNPDPAPSRVAGPWSRRTLSPITWRSGGEDLVANVERTPVGAQGSGPYAVVVDPQHAVWTTLVHSGQVARLPACR